MILSTASWVILGVWLGEGGGGVPMGIRWLRFEKPFWTSLYCKSKVVQIALLFSVFNPAMKAYPAFFETVLKPCDAASLCLLPRGLFFFGNPAAQSMSFSVTTNLPSKITGMCD